jgi:hypothetical protein
MAITLNSKVYNFIGFDKNGVSVYQDVCGSPYGILVLDVQGDSVIWHGRCRCPLASYDAHCGSS